VEKFQKEINVEYAVPKPSPLDGLAILFKSLILPNKRKILRDSHFVRTEKPFGMKTSTERTPTHIKYGSALQY
jgi:hypothetical protein